MKTSFLKTLISIAFFVPASSMAQSDSLAVVAFYRSTGGPNWKNHTNWLTAAPLSSWFGLTVSGGRVIEISLPNNNLVSASISDSLNLLTAAQSFNFSHNKLSGYISPLLALSSKMQIDLTYNSFDFSIEFLVRHHNVLSNPQSVGVPFRYYVRPAKDSITFYPQTHSPSGLVIGSNLNRIEKGTVTYITTNVDPICNLIKDSITVPYLPGSYFAWMVDDPCAYAPGTWSLFLNSDTIAIGDVMPVNFIHFDGNISHNTTLLNWQTADNIGASYFDIQRSNDGKLFNTIGKLAAIASSTPQNYQYTDDLANISPLPKAIYYRLKEVDKNGSLTYSKTIALNTVDNNQANVLIYPNPVKNILHVQLNNMAGQVALTITGVVGKALLTKQLSVAGAGNNTVTFNTSTLAAGIYFLQIRCGGKTITEKFIKQ